MTVKGEFPAARSPPRHRHLHRHRPRL